MDTKIKALRRAVEKAQNDAEKAQNDAEEAQWQADCAFDRLERLEEELAAAEMEKGIVF